MRQIIIINLYLLNYSLIKSNNEYTIPYAQIEYDEILKNIILLSWNRNGHPLESYIDIPIIENYMQFDFNFAKIEETCMTYPVRYVAF